VIELGHFELELGPRLKIGPDCLDHNPITSI
jgi:hypothetical protein